MSRAKISAFFFIEFVCIALVDVDKPALN